MAERKLCLFQTQISHLNKDLQIRKIFGKLYKYRSKMNLVIVQLKVQLDQVMMV